MWAVRLFASILMTGTLFAQHDEAPPSTIQLGQRLYVANCVGCHGPNGDAIAGVNLAGNKFRRASTDEDLVRIIKEGIPGTAMPAHNFADFPPGGFPSAVSQTQAIVAYMRYMGSAADGKAAAKGDAGRGKAIFEGRGSCMNCHRVAGKGARLGPELTDVGMLRNSTELERSILDPDSEVLPQSRFARAVTRKGETINGRLLNQDTFSVQLIDAKERLLSVSKQELKEFTIVENSAMPSYRDKLNASELADLISYLSSLKGTAKQ